MKIDRVEAARIAELARLRFDAPALDAMAEGMSGILDYIDQLREVDAGEFRETDAAPTPMREDEPRPSLDGEAVRGCAPSWRDGFFVVPRVLSGE